MGHNMVYFVAAAGYSDLKALRNAGIIDAHLVVHGGGVTPPQQFVSDCNAAGLSPILNNGNDGAAGWNGSDSYNANLAAMGFHAVGGESEQAPEIDSIMNHLIFLDYGGQGTAGGTNDDIWYATHPAPVHGNGCAAYLETYDSATNVWGWNVLKQGVLDAKSHGVKEIGLLVGNWMMSHSTAQTYIDIIDTIESNGITCAGIGVWAGYGSDMNQVYNQFASWYKAWMAIWPPTMVTMKDRFSGGNVLTTTTKLKASNVIINVGESVTFTATLMAGTTPVAGRRVLFSDGGSAYTDASGNAEYTETFNTPGVKTFTASWPGDSSYGPSKSGAVTVTVGPTPPPAPIELTSSPAAVSWGNKRIDIFARGEDNALWHISFDGSAGGWGQWESLGGVLASAPAAAAQGANKLDIFVRGTESHLWHKSWAGSSWTNWEDLGGELLEGTGPGVSSWAPGRLDVFVIGANDKHLWHKWWDGTKWSDWEEL